MNSNFIDLSIINLVEDTIKDLICIDFKMMSYNDLNFSQLYTKITRTV